MPARTPEDVDRLLCEAISAGDLEAALAFYEPEAQFVAEPGHVVTGRDAIREVLSHFLALKPTLTMDKVTAVRAGDIALLASIWSLTSTGSDGKTINLSGQGQEVVRRQPNGSWQFVIDAPNGLSSSG
jgi:uncharacterized protein (TIGR02246 family)